MNARHKRWDTLMAQYKGKIIKLAEKFLADHLTPIATRKEPMSERSAAISTSLLRLRSRNGKSRLVLAAAQSIAKAADSSLVEHMSLKCRPQVIAPAAKTSSPRLFSPHPAIRMAKARCWKT